MTKHKKIRLAVMLFVTATVSAAVSLENGFLAVSGVVIGMLFMFLVRKKFGRPEVDERIVSVSGLAGRATYAIVTTFLALLSLIIMLSGNNTGQSEMEMLGIVLSYIALLNIAIYSLSFFYYNRKYGAGDRE